MYFLCALPQWNRSYTGLSRGLHIHHRQILSLLWTFDKRDKSTAHNIAEPDGPKQFENISSVRDDHKVKPFSAIPGPKGLPYFGLMFHYKTGVLKINELHHVVEKYYQNYGKIMKETIAGQTTVHLFDPDHVKEYFYHEDALPNVPPIMAVSKAYREDRNQSPGLGNSGDEEWYRLRSGVNQAMLRPQAVLNYFPKVNIVADEFLNKVKSSRDDNDELPGLQNEIYRWTLESAWATAFEGRLGCMQQAVQDAEDIIKAKSEIFLLSTRMRNSLPWFKYFSTPKRRKVYAAEDVILNIVKKHMDIALKTIDDLTESGEIRDDQFKFLRHLLSKPQLNYSDILILTLSLPFDGISTTSRMLSFNLYSLAKNPDAQEKLFREIDRFYHGDGPLTSDNLSKMSYLKACVKESFRFFPIGIDISRVTKKDMVIGGYQIPAGTQIEMNNFVMSRLPEHFVKPEVYMPERWIRDESTHNIHPFIMLSFGHGPRMCIGRRLAEQELYTIIAKLVKNFRLEWHHEDLEISYNILLDPSRPVQIRFVDRK